MVDGTTRFIEFGDLRSLVHERPVDVTTCVWALNVCVPDEKRMEWLEYAYGALHDVPRELSIIWFLTVSAHSLYECVRQAQEGSVPEPDRLSDDDLSVFLAALAWSWDEGAHNNVMMARKGMYLFWQSGNGDIEYSALNADFIPGLMGDTDGWPKIRAEYLPPDDFTR